MKIFAVYAVVDIENGLTWLEDFRKKYDEPYPFHITLKQPCYINESEIRRINNILEDYFRHKNSNVYSSFSKIKLFKTSRRNDGCIMLLSKEDSGLIKLQKEVTGLLKDYQEYTHPSKKTYEENFEPHLTIGRHLSWQKLKLASSELPKNIAFSGKISKCILAIVPDMSGEEVSNPKNLTTFNLK